MWNTNHWPRFLDTPKKKKRKKIKRPKLNISYPRMDKISFVHVIYDSYIYTYIYTIYIADYCHFLRHVCPRNPSNRPELNRLESRNVEPTTPARVEKWAQTDFYYPLGKQRSAEKLVQLIILRSHPIISGFSRAEPRPPRAQRSLVRPSFPRTQVHENKPCPILPSPPIDLYSRRVVRPLTRYTRAHTHTHTSTARGWRNEGGRGGESRKDL